MASVLSKIFLSLNPFGCCQFFREPEPVSPAGGVPPSTPREMAPTVELSPAHRCPTTAQGSPSTVSAAPQSPCEQRRSTVRVLRLRARSKVAPMPSQIALGQDSTKDPSHRETEGTDTSDVRKPRVVLVKEAPIQRRFDFTSVCINTTLNPAPRPTNPSTPGICVQVSCEPSSRVQPKSSHITASPPPNTTCVDEMTTSPPGCPNSPSHSGGDGDDGSRFLAVSSSDSIEELHLPIPRSYGNMLHSMNEVIERKRRAEERAAERKRRGQRHRMFSRQHPDELEHKLVMRRVAHLSIPSHGRDARIYGPDSDSHGRMSRRHMKRK